MLIDLHWNNILIDLPVSQSKMIKNKWMNENVFKHTRNNINCLFACLYLMWSNELYIFIRPKGREKKWNNNNKWKFYNILHEFEYYPVLSWISDWGWRMPHQHCLFIVSNESLPLSDTHSLVIPYPIAFCRRIINRLLSNEKKNMNFL